jgi:hypothetical protein
MAVRLRAGALLRREKNFFGVLHGYNSQIFITFKKKPLYFYLYAKKYKNFLLAIVAINKNS